MLCEVIGEPIKRQVNGHFAKHWAPDITRAIHPSSAVFAIRNDGTVEVHSAGPRWTNTVMLHVAVFPSHPGISDLVSLGGASPPSS